MDSSDLASTNTDQSTYECELFQENLYFWSFQELKLVQGVLSSVAFIFCADCTSSIHKLCCTTEVHLCQELKSPMKLKWSSTQAEEIEGASHSILRYIWFFLTKTKVRCLLLKLTFLPLLNLLSHLPFLSMIDCCVLKTATELFGSLRFWIVL